MKGSPRRHGRGRKEFAIPPQKHHPLADSREIAAPYDNRSLADVNDHEVRMSVMTAPFSWHYHPDSDEVFIGVDGGLIIEFRDGEVVLGPGEMVTVPRGVEHRTRPLDARSVNLTIERKDAATQFVDDV